MNDLIYALLTVPIILIIATAIFGNFSTSIDQTGWSTSANSTLTKVTTGTWNGFSLGSLLPFVLIAVTIVSIILGTLAVM